MAVTLSFTLRGRAQTLALDATLSTQHSSKVAITKHPVESGSKIADNVRPEEESCQIEGFISDTPIKVVSGETYARGKGTRSNAAILTLYALQENAVLVTVLTSRRVYKNMILRDLSIPEESGEAIKFSGTFEKVRFATTQQVLNPNINQGKEKQNGGTKPTRDAPGPVARKTSWLYQGGDAVATQAVNLADWLER